jgi:hypothetical protein
VPIGIRFLYRIFVPFTDVFVAPKIVQAVAFSILVAAAVLLAHGRRAGLGAGVLLLFFVLHDWFAVERVAGGLPRAFGFPCFALWLAGVLGNYKKVRYAAPAILALTYPSVMNMVLAAEGLYALRGLGKVDFRIVLSRLRRYALLVLACLVLVLPSLVGGEERGPLHTLEQAEREPAFSKKGRLWVLPFDEPTEVFLDSYIDQLMPRGSTPMGDLFEGYRKNPEPWAVTLVALLLLMAMLRLGPPPHVVVAFTCGTVVLYLMSRVLAFQLFSPERYYSFGMRMAAIALLVTVPAQLFFWLKPRARFTLRNFTAALLVVGIWGATGTGQKSPSGMFIDRSRDRPLYEYIATLDKGVRIATHPLDGDNIPYYSGRATMGGFETLQPWFVDAWRRQKARAEATLSALYSDDESEVLRYARENGVSHCLVNRSRYRSSFASKAGSFQPLTDYARRILRGKRLGDLVLAEPPKSAIVYESGKWAVVDVGLLERAWKKPRD